MLSIMLRLFVCILQGDFKATPRDVAERHQTGFLSACKARRAVAECMPNWRARARRKGTVRQSRQPASRHSTRATCNAHPGSWLAWTSQSQGNRPFQKNFTGLVTWRQGRRRHDQRAGIREILQVQIIHRCLVLFVDEFPNGVPHGRSPFVLVVARGEDDFGFRAQCEAARYGGRGLSHDLLGPATAASMPSSGASMSKASWTERKRGCLAQWPDSRLNGASPPRWLEGKITERTRVAVVGSVAASRRRPRACRREAHATRFDPTIASTADKFDDATGATAVPARPALENVEPGSRPPLPYWTARDNF